MNAHAFAHTDVGRVRATNEDAYWFDDELGAFLVCDGMGGHANGELAARLAVESVQQMIRSSAETLQRVAARPRGGHGQLADVATAAAEAACRAVYSEACANPHRRGMGCTLTLLLVANGRAAMAHVGDTRLYLLRDGSVDQLSSDHTVVADLVRSAQITPEAARGHELSGALTRAVGVQEAVEVETLIFDLIPDDVLLLCSDGVAGVLESQGELAPFLSTSEPEHAPRALTTLAGERGGSDNATAVVVKIDATVDERIEGSGLAENIGADLAVLREAELLAGLPLADLLRLYAIADVVCGTRGQPVLEGAAELNGLHCLLAGELRWEDAEGTTRTLTAGDCFGGPSLLVRGLHPAVLRGESDHRLLIIRPEPMLELGQIRSRFVLTLLARIMQRAFTGTGPTSGLLEASSGQRRKAWWNPVAWARSRS